jgi:transposase
MELRAAGHTLQEIGNFLKIHVRTIQHWIKRLELEETLTPKLSSLRQRKINKAQLLSSFR